MTVKKKKRVVIWALVVATILLSLLARMLWENTAVELNSYVLESDRLPAAFDGFRIAQVSDLHNTTFGEDNEELISLLAEAKPDVIAITGDLIDSNNPDVGVALRFARQALQIAPCYFVTGNHEFCASHTVELMKGLMEMGVIVLTDSQVDITRDGAAISLFGVRDLCYEHDYWRGYPEKVMRAALEKRTGENCTVLLSHRPELFGVYVENGIDLALTGHSHGGQFRLPFIGGIYAPDQGLLPKYDAGLFAQGRTQMIVSKGFGNSIIPTRFCNRPELVLVELKQAD